MALVEHSEQLLLGKSEEGYAFSETYHFPGADSKTAGTIFFAMEMPNNPVLGEEIGQAILQCLKENFYDDISKDPYLRFEEVLKKVNALVLQKEKEKQFKFGSNLSVACGIVARDNLYLSQAGDAEVYLVRGKYVSVISEGLAEEDVSNELFSNIASGTLEDKDVVIFSSTKLFRYLTEIDLAKIFSNYNLPEALRELQGVLKREILNPTTVLGVDIKQVDPVTEELPAASVMSSKNIMNAWQKVRKVTSDHKEFFQKRVMPSLKSLRSWKSVKSLPRVDRKALKNSVFQKRKIFLAGILLLVGVLGFGVYQMKVRGLEIKKINQFEADLLRVRDNLDMAKTKANYDKEKAGQLLKIADESARKVFISGYLKKEANLALEQINLQKDNLDNIRRVASKERRNIADLAKKRSNVNAMGVMPYKDRLAVFEYNALYEVVLDTVTDPLTIDSEEHVIRGRYFEDQGGLVFLTRSGKLIEYKDGLFNFMDTEDKAWHTGTDLAVYSDKVYILDAQNNVIWKYRRKRDNYSVPDKYLSDVDLTGAVSMAIDGSVYLLKSNGVIEKYYVGKKRDLRIDNAPIVAPQNPRVIYTEKEMDQIYVLDATLKRVLIYYKSPTSDTLTYNMQLVFEDLQEEFKDIYVDKKAQRLYLLTSSALYEVEL